MPDVMIQYRAASFFGRMNCPDMIMGIYSQDEVIDGMDNIQADYGIVINPDTGEIKETPLIEDKPITQEQRQELFKIVKDKLGADGNDILKKLITEEGYESTNGMPTSALNRIIEKVNAIADEGKGKAGDDAKTETPEEPAE